jgi:adenylate cyclase
MFTDVVGYTALMRQDEEKALELLTRNRSIQRPLIERYKGKWLKEMGDGVLASFNTVSNAVFCAAAIQQTCENEADLKLRIGIHQGEVVFENNDVFGDGVNIASRIESLAPPGSIYVSAAVFHNISNRKEFETKYISKFELKNIDYPIEVYQVNIRNTGYLADLADKTDDTAKIALLRKKNWIKLAAIGTAIILLILVFWWVLNLTGPSDKVEAGKPASDIPTDQQLLALPSGPRIAVLQFANLSNNPEQDYFSDGLTEDIITALSQTDLFVLGSSTSFRFNLNSISIGDIGKELEVRYLLKGSVRRQQNTIRVTAQLIDVTTTGQLWGATYDRDLTTSDIFALQDDITRRVVSTIADFDGVISRTNLESSVRKHPSELDAYECVLRRVKFTQTHTPEDHLIARDCLEETLKKDSAYVDGMAALAYLYREEYQHEFNRRPKPLERAVKLARKAIELDPVNQQAYYALALGYFGQRKVDDFFLAADRAIALNPNNSSIIGGMGVHIALAGEWSRGIGLLEKTMLLNPYSSLKNWLHFARASNYCLMADYSNALTEINQVQFSDLPLIHINIIAILAQVGQEDKAKEKLAQVMKDNPEFLENARDELERFYLVDHELVDLFLKNLNETERNLN